MIGARIKASHITSYRTYGARHFWHDIQAEGTDYRASRRLKPVSRRGYSLRGALKFRNVDLLASIKPRQAIGVRVDDRLMTGRDVRDEMACSRADAETMATETCGQN